MFRVEGEYVQWTKRVEGNLRRVPFRGRAALDHHREQTGDLPARDVELEAMALEFRPAAAVESAKTSWLRLANGVPQRPDQRLLRVGLATRTTLRVVLAEADRPQRDHAVLLTAVGGDEEADAHLERSKGAE